MTTDEEIIKIVLDTKSYEKPYLILKDKLKLALELKQEQTNQNIIKLREELKKKIKTTSIHQVINGKANKHDIELFSHAESIGREDERKLCLKNIDELFNQIFPQIGNHNSLSDTEESNSLDNVPSKDKIMNNSEQDVISNCKYFNRSVSEVNNQEIMEFLERRGWKEGVYNLNRRKNNE